MSPTTIVRYNAGGFYQEHRDSGPTLDRIYSFVTYLNGDFTGGSTVFPDRGMQVKATPGHAVVFPSDELHKGDTVTSGTKFIATTWLLSG
ncbi:2OG-Fe(II) oxygenase [Mesorhizobium sp. M0036]|uniref:2OG-Fe(II) oxygenase n=1 Tax=Mesorhizobium sp. M0036 TaxID=2956853 RepID=UPI00333BAE71